jgi:hypothetical protein
MTEKQFQLCVAKLMSINDANSDMDNLSNELAVALHTMEIFASIPDIISVLEYVNNRPGTHRGVVSLLNDYISSYNWELRNSKK